MIESPEVPLASDSPAIWVETIPSAALFGGARWVQTRQDWVTALGFDDGGSVYLHPDLIYTNSDRDTRPIVLTSRSSDNRIRLLAVLRPAPARVQVIPGLPIHLSLRRLKLFNTQLLGVRDVREAKALIDGMSRLLAGGQADDILFEEVEVDSPLWTALMQVRDDRVHVSLPAEPQPHHWLEFTGTPDDYWKKFSSRTRYNLKSRVKKFPHTVKTYRRPKDVAEFLAKGQAVSEKSWQTKLKGLRIHNNAEMRKYWELVASLGALRSFILEHDGVPVAFVLGVQWKNCFYSEELGYDSAIAEFAPGTVLNYRIIEDLISGDTPRVWDFGFGENEYKRILGTRETRCGPVLLVRRAWRPMTALHLVQARYRLGKTARSTIKRLGLTTAIRRLYRGRGRSA